MKQSPELRLLLTILDQAYDRPSWHGTNLRGSIRRVSAEQAAWRPGPARHNIWETVVHAAYWKYAASRRFTGEARGSFIALLAQMHRVLRDEVARLSARELARTPRGTKVSNCALLSGIAAHDLYHAGQIQLLKRLAR